MKDLYVIDTEVTAKNLGRFIEEAESEPEDNVPGTKLGAMSEQHFRAALAALETARAQLMLAHYHSLRGD